MSYQPKDLDGNIITTEMEWRSIQAALVMMTILLLIMAGAYQVGRAVEAKSRDDACAEILAMTLESADEALAAAWAVLYAHPDADRPEPMPMLEVEP